MKFCITPNPPFNFDLTAGFFSYDDEQIRKYDAGIFQQVIQLNNKLAIMKIQSMGNVDKPKLVVNIYSNKKLNNSDKKKAAEIINLIFNLDLDLNIFYEIVKTDRILSKLVNNLRGLKGPNNSSVFEGLVCSIIEQQISLNVAFSIQKKFTKRFGEKLILAGKTYFSFPKPENIMSRSMDEFRACGLSQRKGEYIRGISELIVNNKLDLEKYKNYPSPSKVISELTKLRGIGVWTVELTMLRSMQRFDIVPADDLGLKRYIAHHYFKDKPTSSADVRAVLDKYGAWKGLAAYYFLEADRLGLTII
jgi:DNA-3-methyladenine glycosylase II